VLSSAITEVIIMIFFVFPKGPKNLSERTDETARIDLATPNLQLSSTFCFKIDQDWNIMHEASVRQISVSIFFIIFSQEKSTGHVCLLVYFNWRIYSRILMKSGINIRLCTIYEDINFLKSVITTCRTHELVRWERQWRQF
jgi:hypothetical protein